MWYRPYLLNCRSLNHSLNNCARRDCSSSPRLWRTCKGNVETLLVLFFSKSSLCRDSRILVTAKCKVTTEVISIFSLNLIDQQSPQSPRNSPASKKELAESCRDAFTVDLSLVLEGKNAARNLGSASGTCKAVVGTTRQ